MKVKLRRCEGDRSRRGLTWQRSFCVEILNYSVHDTFHSSLVHNPLSYSIYFIPLSQEEYKNLSVFAAFRF